MNYEEAMEYIHNTLKFGLKLGLHNISTLLDMMGNPHKKLKYVHVAGTNGKGSTVAFISQILMEAGYKVGIYTSPYLERFTERIRINDREIPEDELARLTSLVKDKVDEMLAKGENHPTEFEIITALAFQYFFEQSCDIVVLEVGLGGRFDSTNIIDTPLAAVITTISYDHKDRLGNTLGEIAYEKAGIIKPDGDVVLYPQSEEALEVFEKACSERAASLHKVDLSGLAVRKLDIDGQVFNFNDNLDLKINLLGEHQVKNAVTALSTVQILRGKGLCIPDDAVRKGLANTRWPGRLEIVNRNPIFLIDGAHNPEGIEVLKQFLMEHFQDKRKIFIMGVLKDKEYKLMVETIVPMADLILTVTPNNKRSLPASELADFIKAYCKNVLVSDKIGEAVRTSLNTASPDDVICAFGSLYYIGEVRSFFTARGPSK
jgi:dihydrofolate synthase/folylpolyglutamate synthase